MSNRASIKENAKELVSRVLRKGGVTGYQRSKGLIHKLPAFVRHRRARLWFIYIPSSLLGSISDALYRVAGAPDGLPIPPSRLIFLVDGSSDIYWFFKSGYLGVQSMVNILERNGLNLKNFHSILDFGCGCGRVIRYLKGLKNSKLYGTDYNSELISWCKQNLPFATFKTNRLNPPLDYEDGKFDFIYALSVFTHLPEELQLSWRDAIRRVLKPGGIFLMTTHGNYYFQNLTPSEKKLFRAGQLVVRRTDVAGSNVCGAFHPVQYVRDKLAKGFTIIDFIPEGARGSGNQDIFLLKRC